MLSYQSTYALVAGVTPQPQGARHDSIPTYRSFVAADGRELVVTANTERMWRGLCEGLGLPELVGDPRFLNGAARLEHREALWPLLEAAFLKRDAADWITPLAELGVPIALIKLVNEALDDARDAGREMVVPLMSETGEKIEVVGNPIKFVGPGEQAASYPPVLGAHAEQVLGDWLALEGTEIDRLCKSGVVLRRM
jgi:CoA:oxalate CoA-transferase